MQLGAIFIDHDIFNIELPKPDDEVIPGVPWGAVEAFPSPAYWAYQVYAHRLHGNRIDYKLGATLKEEVGACLLGGTAFHQTSAWQPFTTLGGVVPLVMKHRPRIFCWSG